MTLWRLSRIGKYLEGSYNWVAPIFAAQNWWGRAHLNIPPPMQKYQRPKILLITARIEQKGSGVQYETVGCAASGLINMTRRMRSIGE